mmetsp:Transcript_20939/g.58235  ORF Transcript_20939/g.58235 Transcript_20939/m.58235 type:complete len:81 (+) Transcript_20939:516-758(+)
MVQDPDLPNPAYVATFGSARVGDAAFQQYFDSKVNQTTYENHLDLIPFLPPNNVMMDVADEDMEEMMDKYVPFEFAYMSR